MPTELACARILLQSAVLDRLRVLTVGGANIEHTYALPRDFKPDAKISTSPQPRLAGGSSVNHACRFLAMGADVYPVLPLAKADPMSAVIVDALEAASRTGHSKFRRSELAVPGTSQITPYTTIIRQGGSRASLNEFSPDLMTAFAVHIERHLARAAGRRSRPDVVLVGHIHADRAKPGRGEVGFEGALSEEILTSAALSGARKFVNFGSAQYEQGTKRWSRILRDHVDVFQLDISEMRRFTRDAGLQKDSIAAILGWFRNRATVVISLGRFGSVGQLAGSDRPIAAWPTLVENVVDSTGAGDAMGAGIVASMMIDAFGESDCDDETRHDNFAAALSFGRTCGAYACTTLGGSNGCPSLGELLAFEARERGKERDLGLSRSLSDHDLLMIDRAYKR